MTRAVICYYNENIVVVRETIFSRNSFAVFKKFRIFLWTKYSSCLFMHTYFRC